MLINVVCSLMDGRVLLFLTMYDILIK